MKKLLPDRFFLGRCKNIDTVEPAALFHLLVGETF